MGLAHCPLCIGLALLSLVRGCANAVQLWQLLVPAPSVSLGLQGT
ncbi:MULTISPECIES: hypothetical protein [Aphanothece]